MKKNEVTSREGGVLVSKDLNRQPTEFGLSSFIKSPPRLYGRSHMTSELTSSPSIVGCRLLFRIYITEWFNLGPHRPVRVGWIDRRRLHWLIEHSFSMLYAARTQYFHRVVSDKFECWIKLYNRLDSRRCSVMWMMEYESKWNKLSEASRYKCEKLKTYQARHATIKRVTLGRELSFA